MVVLRFFSFPVHINIEFFDAAKKKKKLHPHKNAQYLIGDIELYQFVVIGI